MRSFIRCFKFAIYHKGENASNEFIFKYKNKCCRFIFRQKHRHDSIFLPYSPIHFARKNNYFSIHLERRTQNIRYIDRDKIKKNKIKNYKAYCQGNALYLYANYFISSVAATTWWRVIESEKICRTLYFFIKIISSHKLL